VSGRGSHSCPQRSGSNPARWGNQALTKLFLETRPETTPKLIGDVVEQIDKIVKVTRFEGWQNSNSGPREIQKALMLTLAQFGLSKDKSLFEKAYAYIEGHY